MVCLEQTITTIALVKSNASQTGVFNKKLAIALGNKTSLCAWGGNKIGTKGNSMSTSQSKQQNIAAATTKIQGNQATIAEVCRK